MMAPGSFVESSAWSERVCVCVWGVGACVCTTITLPSTIPCCVHWDLVLAAAQIVYGMHVSPFILTGNTCTRTHTHTHIHTHRDIAKRRHA